jgi:hypothetical protein
MVSDHFFKAPVGDNLMIRQCVGYEDCRDSTTCFSSAISLAIFNVELYLVE